MDEVLAILPASGVVGDRKFVHSNHLYSVAALTDNNGAVVERYRYDAYGQRTVLEAEGTTVRAASLYGNQIGFTGRYLDNETGLYYFRNRMYSGSLGRFVSQDPLEYPEGYNLYNAYFVPEDTDPSGLIKSEVIIASGNVNKLFRLPRIKGELDWERDCSTGAVSITSLTIPESEKDKVKKAVDKAKRQFLIKTNLPPPLPREGDTYLKEEYGTLEIHKVFANVLLTSAFTDSGCVAPCKRLVVRYNGKHTGVAFETFFGTKYEYTLIDQVEDKKKNKKKVETKVYSWIYRGESSIPGKKPVVTEFETGMSSGYLLTPPCPCVRAGENHGMTTEWFKEQTYQRR